MHDSFLRGELQRYSYLPAGKSDVVHTTATPMTFEAKNIADLALNDDATTPSARLRRMAVDAIAVLSARRAGRVEPGYAST